VRPSECAATPRSLRPYRASHRDSAVTREVRPSAPKDRRTLGQASQASNQLIPTPHSCVIPSKSLVLNMAVPAPKASSEYGKLRIFILYSPIEIVLIAIFLCEI